MVTLDGNLGLRACAPFPVARTRARQCLAPESARRVTERVFVPPGKPTTRLVRRDALPNASRVRLLRSNVTRQGRVSDLFRRENATRKDTPPPLGRFRPGRARLLFAFRAGGREKSEGCRLCGFMTLDFSSTRRDEKNPQPRSVQSGHESRIPWRHDREISLAGSGDDPRARCDRKSTASEIGAQDVSARTTPPAPCLSRITPPGKPSSRS